MIVVGGMGVAVVEEEAALEFLNEGGNGGVAVVEEKHLVGGDDGLDVLQVDDDGPLPPQHRRRVRQLRVQDTQVPRRQPRPPHHRVPPGLHHPRLPGSVHRKPRPDPSRRRLLPPRPGPRRLRLVLPGRGGLPGRPEGFPSDSHFFDTFSFYVWSVREMVSVPGGSTNGYFWWCLGLRRSLYPWRGGWWGSGCIFRAKERFILPTVESFIAHISQH